MAHNSLIRSPVSNWSGGSQILASELEAFDAALASAVNGASGGCWSPQNQITIPNFNITGPCKVAYGGTLTMTAQGAIQLQDGDFPEYGPGHAGATRVRCYPMMDGVPLTDPLGNSIFQQQTGTTVVAGQTVATFTSFAPWDVTAAFFCRPSDGGMQAIASQMDFSDGAGLRTMAWRQVIRAYDQSTLSQVVVNFKVGFKHTDLPPIMPKARVVRIDTAGNVVVLTSQAAGADADGYVHVPAPATASAWYASGQAQHLTIPCDQNNAVEIASFTYAVEVVDESGLQGYPWQVVVKQPVYVSAGGVTLPALNGNGGVVAVDTVNVGQFGERVLVLDGATNSSPGTSSPVSPGAIVEQTVSAVSYLFVCVQGGVTSSTAPTFTAQFGSTVVDGTVVWKNIGVSPSAEAIYLPANGIWNASLNEWTRASDLTLPSDFSQGMIVPVATGDARKSALLQVSSVITDWTPGLTPLTFVGRGPQDDEAPAFTGTALFAHGTIWLSSTVTYTGIADAHFE